VCIRGKVAEQKRDKCRQKKKKHERKQTIEFRKWWCDEVRLLLLVKKLLRNGN
jgi:hypothetical protein